MAHLYAALSLLVLTTLTASATENFARVDADLKVYDDTVQVMRERFEQFPADPADQEWVKKKLAHMVDVDQYMRNFSLGAHDRNYSPDEMRYFREKFGPRWMDVDNGNTRDLRGLLARYTWFKVSEFGAEADQNAFLLVQHADYDPEFQKNILVILESLYKIRETNPSNYAFLFDRVAASWSQPEKRTLQRYGTQGTCVAPETWEPIPMEDPANVDQRRAEVGLKTMAEYKLIFKTICK